MWISQLNSFFSTVTPSSTCKNPAFGKMCKKAQKCAKMRKKCVPKLTNAGPKLTAFFDTFVNNYDAKFTHFNYILFIIIYNSLKKNFCFYIIMS